MGESSKETAPLRVMTVYGTRPEAIKVAPIVKALEADSDIESIVVVTGQHREMLDQVNEGFDIRPDLDLDIFEPGQTLTDVTTKSLRGIGQAIEKFGPDAVVVQGDTTSVLAGAMAGFYAKVPVVHVEAGLRTADRYTPFPEEINRRLTTQLASLHLAPTQTSRDALLHDNVPAEDIVVTGNTVIDALLWSVDRGEGYGDPSLDERLADAATPMVLVTAHRRESWGEPMRQVGAALAQLADRFPDHLFVWPAHRNPLVREAIVPAVQGKTNVIVTEPVSYAHFGRLMRRAEVLLTDSGGVQEEGPSLGKPVLVMRETTERPDAVTAGTAKLVGTDPRVIVDEVSRLLTDPAAHAAMANAINPYGDGRAAQRSVQAIRHYFGRGERPEEFSVN